MLAKPATSSFPPSSVPQMKSKTESKIVLVASKIIIENLVTVSWEIKRHKSPKGKKKNRRKKDWYKGKVI